jgi:hypothetical protein
VLITPVALRPTAQYAPGPEMPQYQYQMMPQSQPAPACPECGTTITVPVQVQLRATVQALPIQPTGARSCP